jgi:tetratricopeptide (TPR) repeat protein
MVITMRASALTLVLVLSLFGIGPNQEYPAEKYFMEGKWKMAIKEYRALAESDSSVETLNRLGEAYFYGNDFRAAEKTFKKSLDLEESAEARILLRMVRAVRNKGRLDDLKDLKKEYGENALLLRSVGVALLHHNKPHEAMPYLRRAKAKDPGDYMTHFYIGLIHERMHQYDACMPAYRESISLNPRFAQAVNNLGYCYKERRYYTYAIEQYEKAIAIEPDNANFHYNLGNAQAHKEMIEEALQSYKRAVELDPEFAKAHYNLGRSYIGLDMLENGIMELKLYLKYFDKSVLAAGAPPRSVVKDEIKLLEEMVEEKEEGETRG